LIGQSDAGEPFLHKEAVDIIIATKKAGIDVALATNGVMFDKEKARKSLGHLIWLKD
jgi:MoaA/NifB/PqqE/SkfB family radical SAM enzyme